MVLGIAPTAAYSPLVEALHRYRTRYPEIELDLREMNSNVMEAQLRPGLIDAAVMRPVAVAEGIETVEVSREPMVLALRRDHTLAGARRLTVEKVAGLPLIGYARNTSPYFRDLIQSMFAHARKRPQIVQDSAIPTVLTLVEIGIGVALVPRTLARMKSEQLCFVPVLDRSGATASLVVCCLQERTNSAIDGFIAAMREADRHQKSS